jgi:hypothetical protein
MYTFRKVLFIACVLIIILHIVFFITAEQTLNGLVLGIISMLCIMISLLLSNKKSK